MQKLFSFSSLSLLLFSSLSLSAPSVSPSIDGHNCVHLKKKINPRSHVREEKKEYGRRRRRRKKVQVNACPGEREREREQKIQCTIKCIREAVYSVDCLHDIYSMRIFLPLLLPLARLTLVLLRVLSRSSDNDTHKQAARCSSLDT